MFKDSDLKILKNLKKDKNIIISRPDKGRGVIIMNKHDYVSKMGNILNDHRTFMKIPNLDPYKNNILLEDKLNRFLKKMHDNNHINETEYKRLYSTGSNPGIMYGLPKVHKNNIPLRPVLSSFKTHNYKTSQFIIPGISKYASNEYTLANSYEFFNDLKTLNLNNQNYIVSFDITSLYTNVPVKETVNIITNLIYNNNEDFKGMTKNDFRKLLELTTGDTYFIFNDIYCKQIDGLAMGSPLLATLANIFLCYHEVKWLEECPINFKPLYYKRYVDDTFVIFRTRQEAEQFLTYLNSRHDKISFTMETEENNQIPFLDVLIKKNNNEFDISIYIKPTYTGLGVNFIRSVIKTSNLILSIQCFIELLI